MKRVRAEVLRRCVFCGSATRYAESQQQPHEVHLRGLITQPTKVGFVQL